MNRLIIEMNREFTKRQINEMIDKLYDEIKKLSVENEDIKVINAKIQKEKNKLAYAYARKIGVILTQKEFNRKYKNKLKEARG